MAELEQRYIVLKLKDVKKLPKRKQLALHNICLAVRDVRDSRGVPRFMSCIVVEESWPEYEPTVAAILSRVDKETAGG